MELYWHHAGRASTPWKAFTHITTVSPTHHWDKYIVGTQTEHLSVAIGIRTNALWLLRGQKVVRYQSRHPMFIARSPQPQYNALCPSLLCIDFISHEAQAGWPPLLSGEDIVHAQNEWMGLFIFACSYGLNLKSLTGSSFECMFPRKWHFSGCLRALGGED